MRKRRRNITVVNNEIDYDKLAEAIVKANNSVQTANNEPPEKITFKKFFAVLKNIIVNKHQTNGTTTSGLLGLVIVFGFNALAMLSLLVLVCGIIALVKTIVNYTWTWELALGNVTAILLIVMSLTLIALFMFFFRAAANEMAKEKDRNYVVAVFSGIVSFAALVVALVALLKGVG